MRIGRNFGNVSSYLMRDLVGYGSISQNHEEYWCYIDLFYREVIYIEKTTKEGQQLKDALSNGSSSREIRDLIITFVVKNSSEKEIVDLIVDYGVQQFKEGRKSKAKDIREMIDE